MEIRPVTDTEDMVGELKLKAEDLRALATLFDDAFTATGDPDKLAQNIRNRAETYHHTWHVLFGLVVDIAAQAAEIEDRMAEERRTGNV